jgi:general L-amino acid transport system substrate-binding protein
VLPARRQGQGFCLPGKALPFPSENGKQLGLEPRWAYNIFSAAGNSGEMFERNFGSGSARKIERGINALWNAGGLMYAPPLR